MSLPHHLRDAWREGGLLLPAVAFVGLFYAYPLVMLVSTSLTTHGEITVEKYRAIVATPAFFTAWFNSLAFAGGSSALALALGAFLAAWTARRPEKVRQALLAFYAIPFSLSGLVVAFGFVVMAGRNGILNQALMAAFDTEPVLNLRSWTGLLFVFPFYTVPLVALVMTPLFERLARELFDAAAICGAGPVSTWRLVILPNLMPGLVAAASLVFAFIMSAFGTALAITGYSKNLLSLQIYARSSDAGVDIPQASALAIALMTTTIVVLIAVNVLARSRG